MAEHLDPRTTAALNDSGLAWEPWELTEDDDYWTLLASLWAAGEGFVVCEHDVMPAPGQITALIACPNPWCGYTTAYVNGQNFGLGLVRFAGSLTRALPHALLEIGELSDATHPPAHWCRLDMWLQRVILWPNVGTPCVHGTVAHTNLEPRHGCHLLAADAFHR